MKRSDVVLSDGLRIHKYEWLVDQPNAHLLLVHGYAEYAGRYDHFSKNMNESGISVTSYDQRGYGRSEGLRAYVRRFEQYVSDLAEMRAQIKDPVFLMGHSMGGLVGVQYALTEDDPNIKGLISSSAALEIDPNFSPILQRLAPIIGWLFPKLQTEKLDKTYLTRDPAVLEAYMNDPLMYLKGTRARVGAEFLKAMKQNSARFSDVDLPLLILHGDADQLTMPGGSKKLHNEATSTDKTLKLYPGLYHELINEPEKEMILKDISSWILERCN